MLIATFALCLPLRASDKIDSIKAKAEQGDANAQFILGNCYEYGEGVAKDEVEAVKWYRKSAEQGDAMAQVSLGFCYDSGTGVAKDEVEAVKWYRLAAEQGDVIAQLSLGICFNFGTGVAKDEVEAYAYYNLAAITNQVAREYRDAMDNVMSSTQRAEGQRRTKELKAELTKSKDQ